METPIQLNFSSAVRADMFFWNNVKPNVKVFKMKDALGAYRDFTNHKFRMHIKKDKDSATPDIVIGDESFTGTIDSFILDIPLEKVLNKEITGFVDLVITDLSTNKLEMVVFGNVVIEKGITYEL